MGWLGGRGSGGNTNRNKKRREDEKVQINGLINNRKNKMMENKTRWRVALRDHAESVKDGLSMQANVQCVQEKLCFFTIHCNPSLAFIAVRDL